MSGDKLREAEQTVEKADNAALEIAVKYERSPDFENSEDLKRSSLAFFCRSHASVMSLGPDMGNGVLPRLQYALVRLVRDPV